MKTTISLIALLIIIIVGACKMSSTPTDIEPVIRSEFSGNKKVFYPSTDGKVSSIVIDKDGGVWYLRMNGFAEMRDKVILFNVNEYCNQPTSKTHYYSKITNRIEPIDTVVYVLVPKHTYKSK